MTATVATGVDVYRALMSSRTLLVRRDRGYIILEPCIGNHSPLYDNTYQPRTDFLWVVSFASDVKTRALQVVMTSWGPIDRPDPTKESRASPAVVQIMEHMIPAWLARNVY